MLRIYREAKQRTGDPVTAWAEIQADPVLRREYQQTRGKGGLVRANWDEAVEIIAAAHVHTIKNLWPGPHRGILTDSGDVDGLACGGRHSAPAAPAEAGNA